jgi:hypothetical protein
LSSGVRPPPTGVRPLAASGLVRSGPMGVKPGVAPSGVGSLIGINRATPEGCRGAGCRLDEGDSRVDGLGMMMTDWQYGHWPCFPAAEAVVLMGRWQRGQGNRIADEGRGEAAGAANPAGAVFPRVGGAGCDAAGETPGGGLGVVDGISITAPHCGHFPFFPACAAGTFTGLWQASHSNRIIAGASAGAGAGTGDLGGAGAGAAAGRAACRDGRATESTGEETEVSEELGICTFIPQLGHLPFRPAVSSGVRINLPQPGQ